MVEKVEKSWTGYSRRHCRDHLDGTDAFDFFYSPITYIRQNLSAIGKKSVSFLFQQMQRRLNKNEDHVVVEAKLIVQEGCGGIIKTVLR
jgi:LacI family transcriptional regulator